MEKKIHKTMEEQNQKTMEEKYVDCYLCAEKAWEKANNTASWRGKIEVSPAYTKATKEFLNSIMATYLFIKYNTIKKWNLSMDRLKCHIIQRVFRKGELWDIKPAEKEYLESHGMKDEYIDKYMYKFIEDHYPGAYSYVKQIFSVELNQQEKMLFSVAKFAATKIEFGMIKDRMTELDRKETIREIERKEADIHLSDYFDEEELEWFVKLTDANRLGRWMKYLKTLIFTDSAHMLLTALLADIITQEFNDLRMTKVWVDPTKTFFTALFHDIIEVWTGDAPSPCKNEIFFEESNKSLRKVFEEFEKYIYKKYFYKYMDPLLEEEFEREIVFDEGTDEASQIVKNADYFSADFETYITIKAGNRDKPYFDIIAKSYEKAQSNTGNLRERTPAATIILGKMYAYTSQIVLPEI